MAPPSPFVPALLVVDMQEDFSPPNGPLQVPEARHLAPLINEISSLPFPIKVYTQDNHPPNHISFSSSHPPSPTTQPFTGRVTVTDPRDASRSLETGLWPSHCVQGTPGQKFISELSVPESTPASEVHVVCKGQAANVEMYSVFMDMFGHLGVGDSVSHDVKGLFNARGVTHVYVTGIASDYCVKQSALDARKVGFEVFVVEDAVAGVQRDSWAGNKRDFEDAGCRVINSQSEEMGWVK